MKIEKESEPQLLFAVISMESRRCFSVHTQTCPGSQVISTPMTYVCGLTHAAGAGILIRGGEHLETLAKVGVVAIDKTGTLTEGRFQVQNLLVLSVQKNSEFISL